MAGEFDTPNLLVDGWKLKQMNLIKSWTKNLIRFHLFGKTWQWESFNVSTTMLPPNNNLAYLTSYGPTCPKEAKDFSLGHPHWNNALY
jgi:hypothetical protein